MGQGTCPRVPKSAVPIVTNRRRVKKLNKFIGIYYPAFYIKDINRLANYLLYYDEIHFALPGPFNVKSWISPENIYKNTTILHYGKNDQKTLKDQYHLESLVSFVKHNYVLIDKLIFFKKRYLLIE